MFRRKDEEMDGMNNDQDNNVSYSSANSAPNAAPSANAANPAPISNAAPAASMPNAPSQPQFRPIAPQAAMAAASRATAAPGGAPSAPAHAAPSAAPAPASAPSHAPAPVAERMPSQPVARPSAKRILTVGPDIQMKGEVTSCDRVIIEGTVDATMRDVHTVELAETGSLKGTAEVEDAEISGSFEGDLIVRGRLTIYTSGRVRGNVTYGEIEIQRGGQISGNIRNAADAKQGNQQPSQKKAA